MRDAVRWQNIELPTVTAGATMKRRYAVKASAASEIKHAEG